jgi:hypothetical protein
MYYIRKNPISRRNTIGSGENRSSRLMAKNSLISDVRQVETRTNSYKAADGHIIIIIHKYDEK